MFILAYHRTVPKDTVTTYVSSCDDLDFERIELTSITSCTLVLLVSIYAEPFSKIEWGRSFRCSAEKSTTSFRCNWPIRYGALVVLTSSHTTLWCLSRNPYQYAYVNVNVPKNDNWVPSLSWAHRQPFDRALAFLKSVQDPSWFCGPSRLLAYDFLYNHEVPPPQSYTWALYRAAEGFCPVPINSTSMIPSAWHWYNCRRFTFRIYKLCMYAVKEDWHASNRIWGIAFYFQCFDSTSC